MLGADGGPEASQETGEGGSGRGRGMRASPVSGSPKKASSSLRPLRGAAGAGSSSGSRGKLVMLM